MKHLSQLSGKDSMLTRFKRCTYAAGLVLATHSGLADPVTDLLSQTGLNALINGSITGGLEVDVLNPTGTSDNDLLGADAFTPENGLGVSLSGTEILGFGNTTGSGTAIPLDFLGLEQLTTMLGLAPDSALVDALRNTVGPDGAIIVPLVDSLQSLSGLGDILNFNLTDAITLPGLSDEAVGLAIAGTDSSGNATTDGLAGVALLTSGASGNGGLIGLAVISGNNSGNGDLIGLSILGDDNTGNGGLTGIAVLGGDQAGNSQTLALSALSGSNTGNSDLAGVGLLNGDNTGNGLLAGVAALNDSNAGNANTAGIAVLNGDNSGNGDLAGVSIINGDNSGSGTAAVAVLSGANSATSDGIAAAIISGENSGSGSGGSIVIGNDNNGDGNDGGDGSDCQGVGCTDDAANAFAGSACSDGDDDGVCDEVDDCKNTPADTTVFSSGCHFDEDTPLVLRGVNFKFDSTDVTEPSIALLREARDIIARFPSALISIDGHTDAKGSERYNEDLSYRRAEAIHQYFVANGINPERLTFRGYGETVPIAANATESDSDYPEGRALNRRVELAVIDKETFKAVKAENLARREAREQQAAQARADEARRKQRAEAAEEKRKKTDTAAQDYNKVLDFLQETGSAEVGGAEQGSADNNTEYSLDIVEPDES